MNYEQIQELIKTMVDSNLTSLELELDGVSLKLKKGAEEEKKAEQTPKIEKAQKPSVVYAEPVKAAKPAEVKTEVEAPAIAEDDSNVRIITSPMVGTFYASAGPGKDNFVSAGSKIKKGQVLCIVEAMKLMNEIEAEIDGEVLEILATNEQMVEYGQPLFKVRMEK